MRNPPPQRKLRRSFGSQPVGCLGGPRQPKAGIAVQVTQAQSSLRTFLSSNDGHLANLVAVDYGDADPRTLLPLYLGISSKFYTNVERLASAVPPENDKPSLARVNIQSFRPVSPIQVSL